MPELSIIIVNWNTREMTLECLRSVFRETHTTSFEIVLVDNGSEDGSAEAVAREFPQVKLLAERVNHGFARANNIAAEVASGRYLLLLNSDTLVRDGAIDKLMHFAHAEPDARIWGGRTLFGDGSLNPGSAWGRITLWSTICFATGLVKTFPHSNLFNPEGLGGWKRDTARQVDIVSGCFFLMERDFWMSLGGFDPLFFMYGEEADLCARARKLGARPAVTPEATIVHYGGASAKRFAHVIVYQFGSKIGLMRRQLKPTSASLATALMLFATWSRATAYGLLGRIAPGRSDRSALAWGEAWARRGEWRHGPIASAIEAEG